MKLYHFIFAKLSTFCPFYHMVWSPPPAIRTKKVFRFETQSPIVVLSLFAFLTLIPIFHRFRMSETSCESRNVSDCKSVAEVEGERDYEVVDLRRAINIVAYLVMSIGMAVFIQFPNFQHHCQLGYERIQFPISFQAKHQKNLYI